EQLFDRQPADALHEPAFDLPAIDDRRKRVADVFEDVAAEQPIAARERIDLDFRYRGAVDEIVERSAASRRGIELNVRRAVVAVREEGKTLAVRGLAHCRKRRDALAASHDIVDDRDHRRIALEQGGGHWYEPGVDLRARIGDGGAVQIGTR